MGMLWIISNRLPFSVHLQKDTITLKPSVGGLATGLQSVRESQPFQWVGWPGIAREKLSEKEWKTLQEQFHAKDAVPVPLSQEDIDLYYHGYANETLWPLSHYFLEKTKQRPETWDTYKAVNLRFFEVIKHHLQPHDTVWVHDYQLMLLPGLLRDAFPSLKIGYFHHIPFPSFELFRLLVQQKALLNGLLGADLIGFHTYDYVRHFMSCVTRILQLDRQLFTLPYQQRRITVDAFPMGIDVSNFQVGQNQIKKSSYKIILSIDRLDYSKGIPERLLGYESFLANHPEFHGKVNLKLIVAPSREHMDSYDQLKVLIEQKVAEINGKYGSQSWMPIWYLYQSFPQDDLMPLYQSADVMLVTPLRDGMNLVAKEYIAARQDGKGVLILSQTAGASQELSEALLVNPKDTTAIGQAIFDALTLPEVERKRRHQAMMKRITRANVHYWTTSFLHRLQQHTHDHDPFSNTTFASPDTMIAAWNKSKKPLFIFDYDGTLHPLQPRPDDAIPTPKLYQMLDILLRRYQASIAIVSGRDGKQLKSWFGHLPLYLAGNHGRTLRFPDGHEEKMGSSLPWKKDVLRILQQYMDQMPGSLIEEKAGGIAFHYRQCEPDMVAIRKGDILHTLETLKSRTPMQIMLGHKVIEVKDPTIHKGIAVEKITAHSLPDFTLVAGDDQTDEAMFSTLVDAHSIHVGSGKSYAKYHVDNVEAFFTLLNVLFQKESANH